MSFRKSHEAGPVGAHLGEDASRACVLAVDERELDVHADDPRRRGVVGLRQCGRDDGDLGLLHEQ